MLDIGCFVSFLYELLVLQVFERPEQCGLEQVTSFFGILDSLLVAEFLLQL